MVKITDKLECRIAVINDSAEIVKLVNSVYRGENSKKGWTTEANFLKGVRVTEEHVKELITNKDSLMILAIYNDKVIGCVQLEKQKKYCYWGMLSVDVNYQNLGVGNFLIKKTEEHSKNIFNSDAVKIKVIDRRKELLEYYIRRGYKFTGEREEFSGPGVFGEITEGPLYFATLTKKLI